MNAELTINLDAIVKNWRSLDAKSAINIETAAVVKANAYGLGVERVAPALQNTGVKTFFVNSADEGVTLRNCLSQNADIFVFSGYMDGDKSAFEEYDLIPLLNSSDQVERFEKELNKKPYGLQLDTGMNRLGMEPDELLSIKDQIKKLKPKLIMSHLGCADEPNDPMNKAQLAAFHEMIHDFANAPKSFSATGGIGLGTEYHFDITRPGVGMYGGLPFDDAEPVVKLSLPVIQTRTVLTGETVGYGGSWRATKPTKVATVASGYADGLMRALGNKTILFAGDAPCPVVGRISMDLITVDVSNLNEIPRTLDILNATQTVDVLADAAGTIGYEILTALGARYKRRYIGS